MASLAFVVATGSWRATKQIVIGESFIRSRFTSDC